MISPRPSLIEKVFARLPLFDGLSADAIERLSQAGLGRGMLTSTLRARLRRAGFIDMGRLALATPDALTSVRKIGPVRLGAIRAHILDELARFDSEARALHGEDATAQRRIDRLRTLPADRLPPAVTDIVLFGHARAGLETQTEDLDDIVSVVVGLLLTDRLRHRLTTSTLKDPAVESGDRARARAEQLRERDREWDEADPTRPSPARGQI